MTGAFTLSMMRIFHTLGSELPPGKVVCTISPVLEFQPKGVAPVNVGGLARMTLLKVGVALVCKAWMVSSWISPLGSWLTVRLGSGVLATTCPCT